MRDERAHRCDHVLERTAVDCNDSRPQEIRPAGLPDDVRTVGERVHPDRIRMEETPVRGIEREDPGMTVADPGHRTEPYQSDQQLVVTE